MATESGEVVSPHLRGVTVTTVATVFGVLAGIGSAAIASGPSDTLGLTLAAVAIVVQFPLFHLVGIDVGDFSTKDKVYVAFMTFAMWFIAWGVLLTAGSFQ